MNQINLPNIESQQHYTKLRQSLLTSNHWQTQNENSLILRFLKGGDYNMKRKQFAFIGSTFALLVVTYAVFTIVQPNNSSVSAQEMAKRGLDKVSQMSSSEVTTISAQIGGNPVDILSEVTKSDDAVKLTYGEMIKSNPWVAQFPTGPGTPDLTKLQFIQYTDENGGTHLIGLDGNNIPVFGAGQVGILPVGSDHDELPEIDDEIEDSISGESEVEDRVEDGTKVEESSTEDSEDETLKENPVQIETPTSGSIEVHSEDSKEKEIETQDD